ncbi:hypothetical protein CUJ89_08500 [Burkholderia pyrrocinia]|uniref:Uncharacterized protein n=1 Tax=Burkholderia pyrrocinia TaxID=60550 RepID=A0A2Z5MUW9_BURPY|nr:hypothetical protein CUJ89_08500 [Burkholderia pyrrocinia]
MILKGSRPTSNDALEAVVERDEIRGSLLATFCRYLSICRAVHVRKLYRSASDEFDKDLRCRAVFFRFTHR